MHIGQLIRTRRLALGATLEQIAFAAAMDASNLSRIERGLQQPSSLLVQRIAVALGIPVASLYENSSETHAPGEGIHDLDRPLYAANERKFLKQFSRLDIENQALTIDFMRLLQRRQEKGVG